MQKHKAGKEGWMESKEKCFVGKTPFQVRILDWSSFQGQGSEDGPGCSMSTGTVQCLLSAPWRTRDQLVVF